VFHSLAAVLCLFTLEQMWQNQVLLRLLVERIPIVYLVGGLIPVLILYALIISAAIFVAGEVVRLLRVR
jgi:hypothetical protein